PAAEVLGRADVLRDLMTRHRADSFADERFGVITVRDILTELEKPGRDPRPDFRVARLAEGVESLKDLAPGMTLEGTVSNVAQFGAFVDLGVHQDGLIHVSQLAHKFVSDAREIVKTGDIVKVNVLEVDLVRQRISLTMKLDAQPPRAADAAVNRHVPAPGGQQGRARAEPPAAGSAMAAAFAKLRR
ncbi:MAG: S1 RNA-binding domain-containing protein, partial [Burkholderiaceae bacterium]